MIHQSITELMKNDVSIIEWIDSIHIHYILTKNLNLDKHFLSVPKKYKRKIKTLSYDYHISKVNLIPILIYEVIKQKDKSYDTDFIEYLSTLSKINTNLLLNSK